MLLFALLLFVTWFILIFVVGSFIGLTGPLFWSSIVVLIMAVAIWTAHFARDRHRPETPDGYTPTELVLIAFFALLAAGGVGLVLGNDADRANQFSRLRRTEADIRTIATAWEKRAEGLNQYNAAGAPVTIPADATNKAHTFPYTFGSAALEPMLEPILVPTYLRKFPRTDGWGHDWQFATDAPFPSDGVASQFYLIRSAGRNGRFDPIVRGNIKDFDCDVVYSNGEFISW